MQRVHQSRHHSAQRPPPALPALQKLPPPGPGQQAGRCALLSLRLAPGPQRHHKQLSQLPPTHTSAIKSKRTRKELQGDAPSSASRSSRACCAGRPMQSGAGTLSSAPQRHHKQLSQAPHTLRIRANHRMLRAMRPPQPQTPSKACCARRPMQRRAGSLSSHLRSTVKS